jgi:hypothetical protein
MFQKIVLPTLAILAVFLGFVALQDPNYVITREVKINAPAEKIWPYLNNSKLAEKWAPWLEVDPSAKMNYSGPSEGVGSKASWESQGQLGTGSATITESIPNQKVSTQLEYVKPYEMKQYSEYLLASNGSETTVTWKVAGKNNFMGRLVGVFMNIDKMVGGMFEKGLANLKNLAEKS